MARSIRTVRLVVGSVVLLTVFPQLAQAQASPYLNWSSCAPPSGVPLQTFACDGDTGAPFDLILTLIPPETVSNVSSATAFIEFKSDQATLPDWWQIQPGGCRADDFSVDPSPPYPSGCVDAWLGRATITAQFQTPCDTRSQVVLLRAIVPPGVPLTLSQGIRYAIFRLRFSRGNTGGAGACGGCSFSACFWNDGAVVESATTGAYTFGSGGTAASWQSAVDCRGGGIDFCGPTSTGRPTWGAIKSLYR